MLHGGGHALVVVLKNRKRLEDAQACPSNRRDSGASQPFIIDDEGDEASLNTHFRRGRRSAIYREYPCG